MITVRPVVNAWVGSADGGSVRLEPSQDWDAEDQFVKDHPDLFGDPVEPVVRRTLTRPKRAVPGEKQTGA